MRQCYAVLSNRRLESFKCSSVDDILDKGDNVDNNDNDIEVITQVSVVSLALISACNHRDIVSK